MIDMKAILCPVDFSEFSRHALAHTVRLARWFDSTVTVLHVSPPQVRPPSVVFGGLPGPIPPIDLLPVPAAPDQRDEILAQMSSFAATVNTNGVEIRFVTREGSPVREILVEAERTRSNLLVLGTHGHSGFERFILGSVTERILRKAACPVLTVPPPVDKAPADALQIFSRILCAADFSEASQKGIDYALALAKEADAELLLMHVIEGVPDTPDWQQPTGPAVVEYLRLSEHDALARMRAALPSDAQVWCRPQMILATGKPYHEILRVARERDAHLIVLGVHGRNAIDRLFFGSTANHVVRTATCPVLTLRA